MLSAMLEMMEFLFPYIKQIEGSGEDSITFEMTDVNLEFDELGWEEHIRMMFHETDYIISFEYGDGNWVTVNFNEE